MVDSFDGGGFDRLRTSTCGYKALLRAFQQSLSTGSRPAIGRSTHWIMDLLSSENVHRLTLIIDRDTLPGESTGTG
jgi:hypothetical protein